MKMYRQWYRDSSGFVMLLPLTRVFDFSEINSEGQDWVINDERQKWASCLDSDKFAWLVQAAAMYDRARSDGYGDCNF